MSTWIGYAIGIALGMYFMYLGEVRRNGIRRR